MDPMTSEVLGRLQLTHPDDNNIHTHTEFQKP